jgi:hypothetical protein
MNAPSTETTCIEELPEQIWGCQIGGKYLRLPPGSDGPMRTAVEKAFKEITGLDAQFTFSGWSETLSESRRAVLENRLPDYDKVIAELKAPLIAYGVLPSEPREKCAHPEMVADSDSDLHCTACGHVEHQTTDEPRDELETAAIHLMQEVEQVGHNDYGADCHICRAIQTVKNLRQPPTKTGDTP